MPWFRVYDVDDVTVLEHVEAETIEQVGEESEFLKQIPPCLRDIYDIDQVDEDDYNQEDEEIDETT